MSLREEGGSIGLRARRGLGRCIYARKEGAMCRLEVHGSREERKDASDSRDGKVGMD
jgi:hypothetical protein